MVQIHFLNEPSKQFLTHSSKTLAQIICEFLFCGNDQSWRQELLSLLVRNNWISNKIGWKHQNLITPTLCVSILRTVSWPVSYPKFYSASILNFSDMQNLSIFLCLSWTQYIPSGIPIYHGIMRVGGGQGTGVMTGKSFLIRKVKATVPHRSPWVSSLKIAFITRFTEVTHTDSVLLKLHNFSSHVCVRSTTIERLPRFAIYVSSIEYHRVQNVKRKEFLNNRSSKRIKLEITCIFTASIKITD